MNPLTGQLSLIIYSKDRAMQLDLLLRSIERFISKIENIYVIYKSSNQLYSEAYHTLIENCAGNVVFVQEQNFYQDTLFSINENASCTHVMFSTDDMVLFKEPPVDIHTVSPTHNNEIFSLRLGYNTIIQNHINGMRQPALNIHSVHKDIIRWNPLLYHPQSNYGYPLAIDMHIFTIDMLKSIVNHNHFDSSNQLETLMQAYRHNISVLSSFKESVAVNIPCNNMSTITIAGGQHAYDQAYLNEQFLLGKRISLDDVCLNKFEGCHIEVPLTLI